MADAKKCDRCGAFYDPKTNDEEKAFITIDVYKKSTYRKECIDLCSDCVRNFWDWYGNTGKIKEEK